MEEYLRILLEQIRCRQAHEAIRDEIEEHIRQQIADNIQAGMSREQAEEAAVLDMGSPVETGIALDRIHRPQIAWKMILFITAITIAASVMHILLGTQEYVWGAVVGLVLMIFMYRLDYTRIAEFAKPIAFFLLCVVFAGCHIGETMYGVTQSIRVGEIEISFFPLMLIYVPLYAAIIYSYYGSGYKGLAKAIIWMILPIIAALRMPSLTLAAILLAAQAVVLTIAVGKGWYHIAKDKTLIGLWGTVLGLPILGFVQKYVMGGVANYQVMRIRVILTGQKEWDYTAKTAVDGIRSSVWIGDSGQNISANLPGGDSQFVLTYLISNYGFVAGILICAALAFLIIRFFMIAVHQHNQLGMAMGVGCAMVIMLNAVINIAQNLGMIPSIRSFLPFFSAGNMSLVVSYMLAGIVLSIYRYKNIYASHVRLKGLKMYLEIDKSAS